jgi:type I restriction enzyme S subunit
MKLIDFPQGDHKRHWIAEYQYQTIPWPCSAEQKKIEECLSAVGRKIEAVAEQVSLTLDFKQGLLQKMFV